VAAAQVTSKPTRATDRTRILSTPAGTNFPPDRELTPI
jgi:hypothetical protein